MSGLVLSWVLMDLTVVVVSTQQLMHIIKTQTLQIRVAPGDPAVPALVLITRWCCRV